MTSLREQFAKGIFNKPIISTIPRDKPFLGTITDDGYCDFDVPEDTWYLEKHNKRAERMYKSEKARSERKLIKLLRGHDIH